MPQIKNKIRGEYTFPSDYTEIPEGGLVSAQNCVINRDSVAEPRRGFKKYKSISASGTDRADQLLFYKDALFAHFGSTIGYDNADPFTAKSGTFAPPSHGDSYVPKIKSMEANSNLYFTSNTGIQKLDDPANTIVKSGAPRGLDVNLSLTGSSGFMTDQTQVAYRLIWGVKDANNNLILGSPSQRAVIINNAGGSRNVIVNSSIPQEVTTAWFFQAYRTGLSQGVAIDPNDEEGLVYEANPNSTDITNKYISFTDATPDDLRGATIYTASSQQGIVQANDTPPSAKDICLFKGMTLAANTIQKQNLTITLLAAGGTSGVANGDILTIAGVTYTGDASEDVSTRKFQIFTGGTASQNIADTANSLVKVINRTTSNTTIYAYYFSNIDDLPGKIYLEARSLGASAFVAIASAHGQAFNPTLPTSGTTVQSTAEQKFNRIHVSKLQQPEAFPKAQFYDVGSAEQPIYRVVPLRDSTIIMKKDGFFRLTGTTPQNIDIQPLDLTTHVLAPETVVALNNQVYSVTNQGISTASDTGIGVISRPIEDQITSAIAFSNFATTSFAVAYETERQYLLFVPLSASDSYAKKTHIYNTFTQAWTHWLKNAGSGGVNPYDNKLYLGSPTANTLLQERKTLDYTDYSDEDLAVTITDVSGTIITLTSLAGISVGDVLTQSTLPFSEVIALNSFNNTITLDVARGFTAAAATIKTSYECKVTFIPQFCGNPGLMKQIREIHPLFKEATFRRAKLIFSSDAVLSEDFLTLTGFTTFLWGYFGWGNIPFGGYSGLHKDRTWPLSEYQRCTWLNTTFQHQGAYAKFALAGFEYTFELLTDRGT